MKTKKVEDLITSPIMPESLCKSTRSNLHPDLKQVTGEVPVALTFCGHEILERFGVEAPERLHRPSTGRPAVCLPSKKRSAQMMLLTWVYTSSCNTSTTQGPTPGSCLWDFSSAFNTIFTRHPPPEAHPAQRPSLHLSVDQQLPDGPTAAGETGEHLLPNQIKKYWCPPRGVVLSPLLFSPYTNDCTSADSSLKNPEVWQMTPLSLD
ncbi:hypothetical protein CRENBAI_024523 [Crenichthys baileyi]|uniref:Uncharacterized protein n=1 Tax=Crenichthys baileyi TaxID=28760 RepID=A0AAV9RWM9_9TELE